MKTRSSTRLASQAAELAFAAPQVVAHRLTRIAFAGAMPSVRDRREFQKMGSEKVEAFYESWNAMFAHAARTQFEMGASMLRSMWMPWTAGAGMNAAARSYVDSMTNGLLGSGVAPVRRRAVANAKRLGRTKK